MKVCEYPLKWGCVSNKKSKIISPFQWVFPSFHLLPAIDPGLVFSASLKLIIFFWVIGTAPAVVQFILILWILNVLFFLHPYYSIDNAPYSQVMDITCKWSWTICIINNNKGWLIVWRKLKKVMIFLHFSEYGIQVHIMKSLDCADSNPIFFCNPSVWCTRMYLCNDCSILLQVLLPGLVWSCHSIIIVQTPSWPFALCSGLPL